MSKLEISLEYASLRLPGHCPSGVWVIPCPDDLHHWCGTLFIHKGYYAGGIFKFTIEFSDNYPFDNETPKINFQTDCFHPLIDQANNGSFNLSLKFPKWIPHENFVSKLLYYLKSCFKRPGLESIVASGDDSVAFNKHAFRLYRDQTDVFATLVAQSSTLSSSATSLYERPSTPRQEAFPTSTSTSQNQTAGGAQKKHDLIDDPHPLSTILNKRKHLIQFHPLDDNQFKQLKQKIFLQF